MSAAVASPRANGDAAPAAAASSVGVAVPPTWFHSSSAVLNAAALLSLRGASDEQVTGALAAVFRARNEGISVARRDRFMQDLGKSSEETDAMLLALSHLIHSFLYLGCDSKDSVFALFPRDFDKDLRRSLAEKMMQKQPEWRETLLQSAVGPAKLVEFGQSMTNTRERGGEFLSCLCSLAPLSVFPRSLSFVPSFFSGSFSLCLAVCSRLACGCEECIESSVEHGRPHGARRYEGQTEQSVTTEQSTCRNPDTSRRE